MAKCSPTVHGSRNLLHSCLLQQLQNETAPLERRLDVESAKAAAPQWQATNEVAFRTQLNDNAMATEKLAEGIRVFSDDARKLDKLIIQAQEKAEA